VAVGGKERHLAFRIATISAVCVGLDELTDSEAVRSFVGRDGSVFAHKLVSLFVQVRQERLLKDGPWFEKGFDAERAKLAAYA
jgi:hypothetical protein